jgi:two-component sensor histidine kinase
MSLVHEMLYGEEGFQQIHMNLYLSELVNLHQDIMDDQMVDQKKKIDIRLQADEEILFQSTQATAVGLIVSEFIFNSIKHAFANVKNPKIEISLLKQENKFLLMCHDNGCGLKETNHSHDTLGFRLIDVFTRQLKGKSDFTNQDGLMFKLVF